MRKATAVLATAQFLVVLSTSIVNVALPSISTDLALDEAALPWVVNAYVLAFGALLLPGGRAADLFGARRVFLAGALVFSVATLAAGLATTPTVLIAARATQGVGAAALAPAALALLVRLSPARNRALALWGAVSAAGGAAGVLLGGILTDAFGWPAVFWTSVPVALAVLITARRTLPADQPRSGKADLLGTVTITGGLLALVAALSEGGRRGWAAPIVLIGLILAVVLLAGFVFAERRVTDPLVPPRLFGHDGVGLAGAAMTVVGGIWVGLFYFLPLLQQQVLGYSPLLTAVTQLPLAAANIAASALTPWLNRRLGTNTVLLTGLAVVRGSSRGSGGSARPATPTARWSARCSTAGCSTRRPSRCVSRSSTTSPRSSPRSTTR